MASVGKYANNNNYTVKGTRYDKVSLRSENISNWFYSGSRVFVAIIDTVLFYD